MASIPDYNIWKGEIEQVIRKHQSSFKDAVNNDDDTSKYYCKTISSDLKALHIKLPNEKHSRKLKASLSLKLSNDEKPIKTKFTEIDELSDDSDIDLNSISSEHKGLTLGKLSTDSIQFKNKNLNIENLSGYDSGSNVSSENLAKFNTEFQTKLCKPDALEFRTSSTGSDLINSNSVFSKVTYISDDDFNLKSLPVTSLAGLIKNDGASNRHSVIVKDVDTVPREMPDFTIKSLLYRVFCCENRKQMLVSNSQANLTEFKSDDGSRRDKVVDSIDFSIDIPKQIEKDDMVVNTTAPVYRPDKKSGHNILMNHFFENINRISSENSEISCSSSGLSNDEDFATLSSLDITTYQQQIQFINSQNGGANLNMIPEIPDAKEFQSSDQFYYGDGDAEIEEEEWGGRFQPVLSVILEE